MSVVLLMVLEIVFISMVIVGLYRLQNRLGLAPVYIFIGSNQYLQAILASTLYVPLFGWMVSPGSVVIFTSSLFTILLVYIKEDVPQTRTLIYGILVSNLTLSSLALLTRSQLAAHGSLNILGISPGFFDVNVRLFVVGTVTLILDSLLIVIVYEFLYFHLPRLPLPGRIAGALLSVLYFDAIVFTTVSFWGHANLGTLLAGNLAGKTFSGIFYSLVLYAYLAYLDKTPARAQEAVRDVFSILTYRERYEKVKTEKTALELARQAADAANRAKTVFLSNMSHEIRTPMNAILGFTQLLLLEPDLTERQRERLQTIGRSGEHLLGLINEILEFSRIEAGRTTLLNVPFDLHALLEDMKNLFQAKALEKGLALQLEREGSVPRIVTADSGKIRQMLINLLGNALKFTDSGGIAIRARSAAGQDGAARLVVEIKDTGMGMSAAEATRIFEAFAQTEQGSRKGGTGLGLAISRQYARLMGGDITVASEPGRGSCFTLTLAVVPAEEAAVRAAESRPRVTGLQPGQGGIRLLVVDDKPDNRTLLRQALAPVGFEIREAASGREALSLYREWSPRAVLMDIRMPDMNGLEAIRQIRQEGRKTAAGIIAVTASAFDENRQEALDTGADAFLRKPIVMDDLFACLGEVIGVRFQYAAGTPAARVFQQQADHGHPPGNMDYQDGQDGDFLPQR